MARAPAAPLPARYVEDRRELVPGHAVKLLRNGAETFPAWLDAIEAARSRISLEMYIFSDDAIAALLAKRRDDPAQPLVLAALDAGGIDNVSAVVIEVPD